MIDCSIDEARERYPRIIRAAHEVVRRYFEELGEAALESLGLSPRPWFSRALASALAFSPTFADCEEVAEAVLDALSDERDRSLFRAVTQAELTLVNLTGARPGLVAGLQNRYLWVLDAVGCQGRKGLVIGCCLPLVEGRVAVNVARLGRSDELHRAQAGRNEQSSLERALAWALREGPQALVRRQSAWVLRDRYRRRLLVGLPAGDRWRSLRAEVALGAPTQLRRRLDEDARAFVAEAFDCAFDARAAERCAEALADALRQRELPADFEGVPDEALRRHSTLRLLLRADHPVFDVVAGRGPIAAALAWADAQEGSAEETELRAAWATYRAEERWLALGGCPDLRELLGALAHIFDPRAAQTRLAALGCRGLRKVARLLVLDEARVADLSLDLLRPKALDRGSRESLVAALHEHLRGWREAQCGLAAGDAAPVSAQLLGGLAELEALFEL